MKTINIHEAKTQLSKLIEEALSGEDIVVSKYGKPLITLTPYDTKLKIQEGIWESEKFSIPDDFDDEDSSITRSMSEREVFP
ncbi:MAG: type II toxin-antitoxin system prevent-host-death family antitoxin [Candidatus Saccharimonadales bacterium]